MLQRVTLRLTGRVQGVFLRASVKDYADSHGLGGFAKNEYDGSVTVSAVGARTSLNKLIDWLGTHPGKARIEAIDQVWQIESKPLATFEIVTS